MRLVIAMISLIAANLIAAPGDLPGVYKPYVAPTPAPTPKPVEGISTTHYTVHKDTMAFALRGGAALPLGDSARNNLMGYSAGFSLVYGASNLVDAAFDLSFASMAYKVTTTTQSLSTMGVGIKAIIKALHDQKLGVNFEGGIGYYFVNWVASVDKGPDPLNPPDGRLTGPGGKTGGGIGFMLGAALNYQFTPNFAASVSADAVQVSLSGGTGDTPLFLTPSLNISYTF